MGKSAAWQRRVEEFVLGQIGEARSRVLEVGCGEGELARVLARAGHSVIAIDPRAPEGPIFRRARIEEFYDPARFDHVVAILSLHHVEDLGRALDNVADLLRAGGTLVVTPPSPAGGATTAPEPARALQPPLLRRLRHRPRRAERRGALPRPLAAGASPGPMH